MNVAIGTALFVFDLGSLVGIGIGVVLVPHRGRHRGTYSADWAARRASACSLSQSVGRSVGGSERHPAVHRSAPRVVTRSAERVLPSAILGTSPARSAVPNPADGVTRPSVVGRATGRHAA